MRDAPTPTHEHVSPMHKCTYSIRYAATGGLCSVFNVLTIVLRHNRGALEASQRVPESINLPRNNEPVYCTTPWCVMTLSTTSVCFKTVIFLRQLTLRSTITKLCRYLEEDGT